MAAPPPASPDLPSIRVDAPLKAVALRPIARVCDIRFDPCFA
jgi:hypothetical protein